MPATHAHRLRYPDTRIHGVSAKKKIKQNSDTWKIRIQSSKRPTWAADTPSHEQSGGRATRRGAEGESCAGKVARQLACSRRPPNRRRFRLRRRRLKHRGPPPSLIGAPPPRDSTSAAADLMSATAGSTSAAVDSSSAAAESTLRRCERRWCAMEQRADGDAGGGADGDGLRGAEAAVRLRES